MVQSTTYLSVNSFASKSSTLSRSKTNTLDAGSPAAGPLQA